MEEDDMIPQNRFPIHMLYTRNEIADVESTTRSKVHRYKVCRRRNSGVEQKNQDIDNNGTRTRTQRSPRSLSFFRNRDSVWFMLPLQPNQQPINHLLDMRHVLLKDRRRGVFSEAILQMNPKVCRNRIQLPITNK